MSHIQQFIAGDATSWHEFTQGILFIVALLGLFVIFMNKIWLGRGILWFGKFALYCVYLIVHYAKVLWNYIAAVWNGLIDFMIETEKAKQQLSIEERIYLDETNLWI